MVDRACVRQPSLRRRFFDTALIAEPVPFAAGVGATGAGQRAAIERDTATRELPRFATSGT